MTVKITDRWFQKRLQMEAKRYGIVSKQQKKDFEKLLEEIPTDVMFEVMHEEAERLSRMVVEEINSQPFWWPPLSEDYRKRKERDPDLSDEMLKATEEYIESIGIQQVERGKKSFKIQVGVPNREHSTAKMNFNKLGRIHEYGTGTDKGSIPARPHWGPVIKRWKKYIPAIFNRTFGRTSRRLQGKLRKILTPESQAKKIKP